MIQFIGMDTPKDNPFDNTITAHYKILSFSRLSHHLMKTLPYRHFYWTPFLITPKGMQDMRNNNTQIPDLVSRDDYFSIFIYAERFHTHQFWTTDARITFKILRQTPDAREGKGDLVKTIHHTFRPGDYSAGCYHFEKISTVCSLENGFYDATNDVVLLDIEIDAEDICSFSMTNMTVLPTLTVDKVKERFTHKTSLQEKKKYLLGSEFRADVWFSFVNSTNVIPAHRLIIEEHSPVLGEMINKSADGQVLIDSHSAEIFLILLRFMYRHELVEESDLKKWISIISAASIFRMSSMLQAISVYLCREGRDLKDTLPLLDAAIVANATELKDALLSRIDEKAGSVLSSPEFLILSRDTVREIIQRDTLHVINEEFVVIYVCKWALKQCEKRGLEQNCTNLRKVMESAGLLRLIRFPTLSITEFNQLKTTIKNEFNIDLSVHQGYSLLSPEESLSIVNYIIDESSRSLGCIFPSQKRLCLRFLAYQIFKILLQNLRQNTTTTPIQPRSTPVIAPARNVQPSTNLTIAYTPQIPQPQNAQLTLSNLLSQTQVPQGQSRSTLPSSANKPQRYSRSSEQNLLPTVSPNSLPNVPSCSTSHLSNITSQNYRFTSPNTYSRVQQRQQQANMTYIQNQTTPVASTSLIVQQLQQQVPQQLEQYQTNSATPPCISIPDNSPSYNANSSKNT